MDTALTAVTAHFEFHKLLRHQGRISRRFAMWKAIGEIGKALALRGKANHAVAVVALPLIAALAYLVLKLWSLHHL